MTFFGNHWVLSRCKVRKGDEPEHSAWFLMRVNRKGERFVSAEREYPPPLIWFMVTLGMVTVVPTNMEIES